MNEFWIPKASLIPVDRPGHVPGRVWRWQGGQLEEGDDRLVVEAPLEIRVDGEVISITMRTPGQDVDLATGFLWTEGVIHSIDDLEHIGSCRNADRQNTIQARLTRGREVDLARLSRHVIASSSCGLCGKACLDAVMMQHDPLPTEDSPRWSAAVLQSVAWNLREAQKIFDATGGLHAAALFDESGSLVQVAEDVGRHNAVDKVLGAALRRGQSTDALGLMVSGRASFEIIQKAVVTRVPLVSAVSAPSNLAVKLATESRQTLIGFLRPGRMNVYCGPERVDGKVAKNNALLWGSEGDESVVEDNL